MRKQKSAAYWWSVTVVVVLFIATLVINYLAGLSADESYFGAHWWHRLAWVTPLLFLASLIWAWEGQCSHQSLKLQVGMKQKPRGLRVPEASTTS